MNQFRIVADSSCDLLTLDGADFVSVPLSIRTDTEEFCDDANLDVDAMVSTLRETKGRSYSACPNIADWESAFGESGNVIAFTITSALSGSYNAACVAKKNCEERNPARPGASGLWTLFPPDLKSPFSLKGLCMSCVLIRTLIKHANP